MCKIKENKLPEAYSLLSDALLEEKMGSLLKRYNASVTFRIKGKKVTCYGYFPNENIRITSEENSISLAYNCMIVSYVLYLEELEQEQEESLISKVV